MNPERKIAPGLQVPEKIEIIRASEIKLHNGLRIYVINSGEEDVVKFEIIFPSGITGTTDYTTALACHQLVDAGTSEKTSLEIAEAFDYFGSHLQTDFGPDWKSLSLYSLARFFGESLDVLMELLNDAVYPENEINTWKTRNVQALQVNREKVSWLAKTGFNEMLFGSHPYGFSPVESDFLHQDTALLRDFFQRGYSLHDATIIVSGRVSEQITGILEAALGSIKVAPAKKNHAALPDWPVGAGQKKRIEKKDAVQSGIRIGKRLFSKTHPDFLTLLIANTVLGGYFGSRLMSNIREDKGYTYGIGSGIHPHLQTGFFFIATEVGSQVREAAAEEIFKELKRLATEPVPAPELELVRNYLFGAFQRSLDGPFALADRFKGLKLYGLTYDFLENYLHLLHTVTPERIMEAVSEHLDAASMTEVVAG